MKARPRRVENRVAEELTKWSAERGDHYVLTRWPAMGRVGPDIYPNPYTFVIDVKSRKSISDKPFNITDLNRETKWWVREADTCSRGWYICRLDQLESMMKMDWLQYPWYSKTVNGWLSKMQGWASDNGGIGMIILHKPRKPIGSSIVVMDTADWLRLMEVMGLI